MKTIYKTAFLRKIIFGKEYYQNRMSEMDRKCAHYLDQGIHASNHRLRDAFVKTAAMYYKRYLFYFNKISNNELRKNIQNRA